MFSNSGIPVLDHFYKNRDGYKLSPAEKRRNERMNADAAQEEDVVMKDDGSEMNGRPCSRLCRYPPKPNR
jgi:hypothetical protein